MPAEWRGIGIRIEDDILVTDGAPVNLSGGLPREPDEITAWMRDAQSRPASLTLPDRLAGAVTSAISGDLVLPPGRGMPAGLTIPAAELVERFSRSSGPGGQGVNTTDSRVELRFDVPASSRAHRAAAGPGAGRRWPPGWWTGC